MNQRQGWPVSEENGLYGAFIDITREEIRKNGPPSFLPTILFPKTRTIKVIEWIPDGTDQEAKVKKWVAGNSQEWLEYFLAYKKGGDRLIIEWFKNGSVIDERIIETQTAE